MRQEERWIQMDLSHEVGNVLRKVIKIKKSRNKGKGEARLRHSNEG